MNATIRAISLSVLLLAAGLASAAPPNTLGYTGRLADSGGNPITADLSITFRLYDVASGGSALWSEVQPAVPVDGGNLAVQLGSVTPLPQTEPLAKKRTCEKPPSCHIAELFLKKYPGVPMLGLFGGAAPLALAPF